MNSTSTFLSHLNNVQQTSGTQWEARCPCHDDNRNSLSIGRGNGATLVKCQAGCATSDIVAAVGLQMSDLFDRSVNGSQQNGRPRESKRIAATYDYRNEIGAPVFQVVRFEPKDFRQRRPEGDGWTWSVKGCPVVPYRLPELLQSADTVFVVEGEKDVDRLRDVGLIATCNAGGAGKWKAEHAAYLRDRDVVILPDADPAGQKHAAAVARSLAGIAHSIKIVALPGLAEKQDLSDWLDAGGSREELLALADAASTWEPSGTEEAADEKLPQISNAKTVAVEVPGPDGKPKKKKMQVARPLAEIVSDIEGATGDWPRRVGSALFVDDTKHGIGWIEKQAAFFGWLKRHCHVKWHRGTAMVEKAELFEELRRTRENYDAVEVLPHHPRMANTYYACADIKPGDGAKLRELVARYSPETDIDGDFILAMFVTPAWGSPGDRPSFGITSDAGRGSGKTTLAKHVGRVWGGRVEIAADETVEVVKQRLLSPEGITKRVAVIDNLKSMRFSSAGLEALITADVISGKRLYVGEASRPNNLLWITTLNGVSFATDWAQRSIIVKLKRPTYSGQWKDDTEAFIDANRDAIIADAIGYLQQPADFELASFTRWGNWERDILARLPEPGEAAKVIQERQGEADAEAEETGDFQDCIREKLGEVHYDPQRDRVFVSSKLVATWLSEVAGERFGTTKASRFVRQRIRDGGLSCLAENNCHTYGRGFVWNGERCDMDSPIQTDLEDRIDHRWG